MKKILEGLQIIAKYLPEGDDGEFAATHDFISAGSSCIGAGPESTDISIEDHARLKVLGWYYNPKYEAWCHHC